MPYATITGQLIDSDGTAWKQATWTAVPVSPSSKPVFPDGSPVPTTSGLLDDTGHFSGQMPQTIDIRPPGTTLTVTLTSMTSAPPVTLTKVQIVAAAVDVGALLSPRIVAPRIKSGPINYAYNSGEITNPVHGNGYVNTYENVSYIYMQNSWVKIGASPNFDLLTADTIDARSLNIADPLANLSKARANYGWVPSLNRSRIISVSETAQLGQYELSAVDKDGRFLTYLIIDQDTGAQFSCPVVVGGGLHAELLAIPDVVDLDVSTWAGSFLLEAGTSNGTPAGLFDSRNAILEVLSNTPTQFCLQRLSSPLQVNIVWNRCRAFGAWTAWHEFTATT